MPPPGRIELVAVSFGIGAARILHEVDVTIPADALTVVVGPSGSGKTTLLKLAAGLLQPTGGEVRVDGTPGVPRGSVKMALQDDPVYGHLDVEDNLGFPLDLRNVDAVDREEAVDGAARDMGIRKLKKRRAGALSGGEQAAVAVGRTLIETGQRFVLLDEPLARADTRRRIAFLRRVRRLAGPPPGMGVIVATNDPADVLRLADHAIVIDGGRIRQQGPPGEVVSDPADTVVAGLVGEPPMNLMPASIERLPDGDVMALGADRVSLPDRAPDAAIGRAVIAGVWPGDLTVAEPATPFDRVIHVTVAAVEPVSGVVRFGLGRHAVPAYAAMGRGLPAAEAGDRWELTWRTGRLRLFAADTGRAIRE